MQFLCIVYHLCLSRANGSPYWSWCGVWTLLRSRIILARAAVPVTSSARTVSSNHCPQFAQITPFDTTNFDTLNKKLALPEQPQVCQNEKCIQRSCGPAKPVECTSPNGKRHDSTDCSVRKGETPNHCVAQLASWNVARQP